MSEAYGNFYTGTGLNTGSLAFLTLDHGKKVIPLYDNVPKIKAEVESNFKKVISMLGYNLEQVELIQNRISNMSNDEVKYIFRNHNNPLTFIQEVYRLIKEDETEKNLLKEA